MTSFVPAICLACKLLQMNDGDPNCEAFPEGIPAEILLGGFDHRGAFPGDGGVRFEQKPGEEGETAFQDWRSVYDG